MTKKKTTKTNAVNLINNTKGKFFTVTFIKKDGTIRTINGNCKKMDKPNPLGYITIYSPKDKGYKQINAQTIKSIVFQGITYKVS